MAVREGKGLGKEGRRGGREVTVIVDRSRCGIREMRGMRVMVLLLLLLWLSRNADGVKRTCLHSSRVGTRRAARAGGRSGRPEKLVVVVVVVGAGCCTAGTASGSVTLVSWDVLMTTELSNSELASGEMDRGCDAGRRSSCGLRPRSAQMRLTFLARARRKKKREKKKENCWIGSTDMQSTHPTHLIRVLLLHRPRRAQQQGLGVLGRAQFLGRWPMGCAAVELARVLHHQRSLLVGCALLRVVRRGRRVARRRDGGGRLLFYGTRAQAHQLGRDRRRPRGSRHVHVQGAEGASLRGGCRGAHLGGWWLVVEEKKREEGRGKDEAGKDRRWRWVMMMMMMMMDILSFWSRDETRGLGMESCVSRLA